MTAYDEHRDWLVKYLNGAEAEYQGFLRAKLGPLRQWYHDPYLQLRFEQGYQDGLAKLAQETPLANPLDGGAQNP
jgi:hypothetical protein